MAKDVIQFVLGATAEYGIGFAGGALTLPVGAEGAAAGPVVETVIDSLFAVDSIKSAVDGISGIASTAGQFSDLIRQAYSAYSPGNWSEYYNILRQIVQKSLSTFVSARQTLDQAVEAFKGVLEELINGITRPIEKSIQFVIPDATIGIAAAKGVGAALKSLTENSYTVATAAIDNIEILRNFVANPDSAISFFDKIIDQITMMIDAVSEKIDNTSVGKSILLGLIAGPLGAGAGLFHAAVIKGFGPKVLNEVSDKIKEHKNDMIDLVSKILKVIIPFAITILALFQIVMKGEYNIQPSMTDKISSVIDSVGSPSASPLSELRRRRKLRTSLRERNYYISSHSRPTVIVAERWQRLAGILKG